MTIDFFKENYPNLYKDNKYYFEHNQTAIEYVVRAYTEGYDSGKMSAENKFEDENRILKSNIEMYKSRAEYLKTEIEELEKQNRIPKVENEITIKELAGERVKYLEEENRKLKADNERLSARVEEQMKERRQQGDYRGISDADISLLAALIAKLGYTGQVQKNGELADESNNKVGTRRDTIVIGR